MKASSPWTTTVMELRGRPHDERLRPAEALELAGGEVSGDGGFRVSPPGAWP